jgi:hypothetical protein
MSPFFRLLLGHLVGDFVLQTIDLVRYKSDSWKGQLLHAAIVIVTMAVFLWGYLPRWWPWLLLIFVLHLLTDWGKVVLSRRFSDWGLGMFFLDQFLHLVVIVAVVYLIDGSQAFSSVGAIIGGATAEANRNLFFVLAFLSAFFIVPVLEAQVIMVVIDRFVSEDTCVNCSPASLSDRLWGGGERTLILAFWYLGGWLMWLVPLAFLPRLIICWRDREQVCAVRTCQIKIAVSVVCMVLLGGFFWLVSSRF